MRTFPDLRFRDLLNRSIEARRALEAGHHEQALGDYRELAREAARLCVTSAFVDSATAKALEELGRYEKAFQFACAAVAKDPLSGPFQDHFGALSWRLRNLLGDPDRNPTEESTPRLYKLLMEAGEADVSCHIAMARFHAAEGMLDDAELLLEAVTRLAPASRDAWRARTTVARLAGNEALVLVCEASAAEVGVGMALPFDVGGGMAEA